VGDLRSSDDRLRARLPYTTTQTDPKAAGVDPIVTPDFALLTDSDIVLR
jgi:hypothetical protein